MEIQEELTTIQVLRQVQSFDYQSTIPDEILSFFDEHFNFSSWSWDNKYLFHQYINNLYPSSINYQDTVIYIDDPGKKSRLLESASWLIKILQDEQSSEKNQKIAFELTCILPEFWAISHEEKIDFSCSSKRLAMEYLYHVEVGLSIRSGASINDKEMIDCFIENLKKQKWKEIAENQWLLNTLYENLHLDPHQSYSFISEHHSHEILTLINQETKIYNLLYWLALLPEKHRQPFALQTTNNLAKFLLLFALRHLCGDGMNKEQIQLLDIWQDCPDEWFLIFNQYAARYPYLQLGLGAFLANASNEKICLYIDSLHLSENEASIKECLEYFFAHATKDKIQHLCRLSYEKWKNWGFGNTCSIGRSILDRALVRYFQTMLSKQDRADFIQNEINQILNFQQQWFASKIELDKFICLHLSRMQPACLANVLQGDLSLSFDDINKRYCLPTQFENDLRWRNWIHLDLEEKFSATCGVSFCDE